MRFFPLILITNLFVLGCTSEVEDIAKPATTLETKSELEIVEEESGPQVPKRIFGLPVPDGAFSHFTIGDDEAVLVKAKLETIKYFYQKNLVDYEIVEQDQRIFIIGLRSFMASAKIYSYTNRIQSPLIIKFSPAKTKFEIEEIRQKHSRKKGSEVKLRTKTGELIAPGARWKEPYTPPVGSPLHKERYRSNWGKPFGDWNAQ